MTDMELKPRAHRKPDAVLMELNGYQVETTSFIHWVVNLLTVDLLKKTCVNGVTFRFIVIGLPENRC